MTKQGLDEHAPISPGSAQKHPLLILHTLALLLLLLTLYSLSTGRYPLAMGDIFHFISASLGWGEMEQARYTLLHDLFIEIRLPRVLAAILIGASLSVSGAAFQGVFQNPLVSPNLLGVLSGAAFGAALGILLNGSWLFVQASSFFFGIAAVVFALFIARAFGQGSLLMLILGGIISGAFFAAMLSIVKYAADPENVLPGIVIWLMGSLSAISLDDARWILIPVVLLVVTLCTLGRWLDALAMGDDEARMLGVPVAFARYGVIFCATLLSALTVSLAGIIGWIGLIVPHVARLITGPGHGLLLPASALLGGCFLLSADLVARNFSAQEIPIGIVTELLGIPVFLLVLRHARRGWSA
ncbi:MAG: iron ABC transporter permease [Zoogloeaceae bacterium]|jgi:iron complex transport system permease protein|nr:iron ABC transporter permease [Zoogloeaceae bacterium]